MVEVKWTDFAIQNLNEIGDYIEKKSYTSYASRVVSGLFAAVDVLERFPWPDVWFRSFKIRL